MWIPCRERVALDVGMQQSEAISVASVKHDLDRFALNVATAYPDEPRGSTPASFLHQESRQAREY